jgi:hypothetical protein
MTFRLRQSRSGKPGGAQFRPRTRGRRARRAGGCTALAVLACVATTAAAPASASAVTVPVLIRRSSAGAQAGRRALRGARLDNLK